MVHPLEKLIAGVRGQTRRLLVQFALGWTLATLTAAVVVLALADYAIRYQDHGIRLMASLAVLGVAAWSFKRYWLASFRRRPSDVEIAHRIERRFPALSDRLASTVEFLKQPEDDPTAGSPVLRRAVILETAVEVEDLDLSQVFDRRPRAAPWRPPAARWLMAFLLAAASPESARIALARLVHPLGDESWPRMYRVEFRQAPQRLAAGQTFEVELLNDAAHRLPEVVRIHYRYDTPGGEEDSEPMLAIATTRVARKEHVVRPFWYRAEGGDDTSMPWMRLEVLEPPRLDIARTDAPSARVHGACPSRRARRASWPFAARSWRSTGTATKKLLRGPSAARRRDGAAPHAIERRLWFLAGRRRGRAAGRRQVGALLGRARGRRRT